MFQSIQTIIYYLLSNAIGLTSVVTSEINLIMNF